MIKMGKYCVKIKLCRYPTSETSNLFEIIMDLFDHGKPKDFLLFMQNFRMALKAPGTLADNANLQYLCTLLHGELLCQFDTLCAHVIITTTTHLNRFILDESS